MDAEPTTAELEGLAEGSGDRHPDADPTVAAGAAELDPAVPPKKRRKRVPYYERPTFVRRTLQSLNQRASKGDADAVKNLELLLARKPELLAEVATLAAEAEAAWADRAAGGDCVKKKVFAAGAAALRGELLGENPTPVERLLVDHVVVADLAAKGAEHREAYQHAAGADGRHRMARAENTQKRLLAAVKTLALIRGKIAAGVKPPAATGL